ncbi:MAG: hypothetical protein A2X34_08275 [Elusimicrobia bacterium GWC2_51_8]|nr:MAG: hypothetical protein A2X33_02445 [Elusimicrobia bacterium GWA2_51_34]OGR59344.1 MAG: hypothetical protein A2X34_08275 [Elusimicrobia bacterium GWC2_51_8]OGR86973.1 MAG: hypothetical protein A2021_01415 [Elusimicrobia bacterium GWF2_52_66]HAF96575.1 ATPase [Elusimicrobiota bacterium]HCE98199.1 ATPase [Elusimicrobiota bacterium]
MNKNDIFRILADWNFWENSQDTGFFRPGPVARLTELIKTGQIAVVTGPRRAGKSFVLKQTARALIEAGTPKKDVLLINLEDPRFAELDTELLTRIFETYVEFMSPGKKPYIFLDEIQEVEGWEKWVNYMRELGKAHIIISGSNAKLLSRELGTLLTGRHVDLSLFPLSFGEFLAFNGVKIEGAAGLEWKKAELAKYLKEYLDFGAYPEVVLNESKKTLLFAYYDDVVTKDLIRRFKIRKHEGLKSIIRFYMSNISVLTTFSSTEKFIQVSADTIEKFSGYLEQSYLLFFLKRFSFKVKEQEKSPRKVYSVDTGLANAIGFRNSENAGRAAENAVFLDLKRRQALNPGLELYYWKDEYHKEVDFVLKNNLKVIQLIQVCWSMDAIKTREREIKNLLKAAAVFKEAELLVISEELEGEDKAEDKTIKYVPLWKWLGSNEVKGLEGLSIGKGPL